MPLLPNEVKTEIASLALAMTIVRPVIARSGATKQSTL
jgi:hypothetical protein